MPVEAGLPEALHETVYDLRYSDDLHVFVLDSSSPLWAEQMAWLEATSATSDATWKVIGMHHSPFRPGIQGYANNPERGDFHRERQDMFLEAARAADIDLILAGHNHSYTRASVGEDVGPGIPDQGARALLGTPRDVEMVVVVSISGAMSGTMTPDRFTQNERKFGDDIALERWANNTPTYQVVNVDADRLSYTSHLGTSEVYDAFTLEKSVDGTAQLTNGEAAFGDTRRFENTGPYRDKDQLR